VKARPGFALIAALWLLVALAALATELGLAGRAWRRAAIARVDRQQAASAAEAGLAHAHARLEQSLSPALLTRQEATAESANDAWGTLDQLFPDSVPLGSHYYGIRARDVGETINVNLASDDELRRLLIALRIDAGQADRLAQSIMDWKDTDELHRARGAEREAYIKAGATELPPNRPLRELGELRAVMGMTSALFDRVAPYLTTVGSGSVNLTRAPAAVLLALPGMSGEAVAVILRNRRFPGRLDLNRLISELSSPARTLLLPHLPALLSRTTVNSREIEVWSEGRGITQSAPTRVTIHALFVRAGRGTIVVGRHTEY
jgi:general secretion pathway protein K